MNKELIELINKYLATMEYGEIVIIKHMDKITIDVKNRNRICTNKKVDM